MVDPMTMMMLVNAGLSVAQGVQGIAQQKKANEELKNLKRPDMVIPEEAKRALGISQSIASDRNQGLEEMEAGLDAGVANSIGQINRQGGSLADRLAAIAGVTADANSQKRAGRFQAEQQNINNLQSYQQQLGQMANEQRMIQQDQLNKYTQQVQSLQGMAGAGQQNMMQGLQGLAGTAAQGLSYKGQMNMMDKQYQNDLNLINAQNGVGGTKAAPNTNMLQDVNVGKQMMGTTAAPSMLQGMDPIGTMMTGQQGVNTPTNTADIEKLMADPNTLNMLNTAMSKGFSANKMGGDENVNSFPEPTYNTVKSTVNPNGAPSIAAIQNAMNSQNISNTADVQKIMSDPKTSQMLMSAMSKGTPGGNISLEQIMKNPQMASMLLSMMSK
jgi:hypothetical protein